MTSIDSRTRALVAYCLAASFIVGCGQEPGASPSGKPSLEPAAPKSGSPANSVPAAPAGGVSSSSAPLPPPGGWIAFDRFDAAFGAEGPFLGTALIRGDGSDERPLPVPVPGEGFTPAWSRDGERLVVHTWAHPGPARPAILDADGSDFTLLTLKRFDRDVGCVDWSLSGDELLCWISDGTKPDLDGIYTLRIDDQRLERLTVSPFHYTEGSAGTCGGGDGRARYSPDGSLIAFVRQRCGAGANPAADESGAIELMASDGSDMRELVEQGKVKSHPGGQISWAPDGGSIAFGSQEGNLYVVEVESGVVTPIRLPAAIGPHHADGPEWAPDGSRLLFSMFVQAEGETDLYTISLDGSDLRRITTGGGSEHWARWGAPGTR